MNESTRGFAERGGFWVVGQAALFLAVLAGAVFWSHQWMNKAISALGLVLIVAAGICGWAGATTLGRNLTPYPVPGANTQLVQTGVYRLLRHPLYTAVFCASVGFALVAASWPALLAAFCLGPFFDAKARVEERALRTRFPQYRDYERRVKRFIPWVY